MYTGATHAATPTPTPIKNLFPICRKCGGQTLNLEFGSSREGGEGVLTHHGPYVVAHRLANGTTYEDYICDPENKTTASVVRQGACPECTKKSTERRGGSDQFL